MLNSRLAKESITFKKISIESSVTANCCYSHSLSHSSSRLLGKVPEKRSAFKMACLNTEWSRDLCQIIEEFIPASPSLGLVPEPEVQTSSLLGGTMQSFLGAVKGNRKMNNLFTQFEPIWVQTSNTEGLNSIWNKRERKSTLWKTHKRKKEHLTCSEFNKWLTVVLWFHTVLWWTVH